MNYSIGEEDLDKVDAILSEGLIDAGVKCAIIIDMAGNTVAKCDDGKCQYDMFSFAALAAGNFAAVDAMAQMVGEKEFSILFHKGEQASIHFSKINDELLLITLFGPGSSLGFLRLKVAGVVEKIKELWAS